jgi:hypothetical protein
VSVTDCDITVCVPTPASAIRQYPGRWPVLAGVATAGRRRPLIAAFWTNAAELMPAVRYRRC